MRMVQYVIQVQQLGLRVGAQKNRLNGIEVILFEYLLCISGFRRKVFYYHYQTPLKVSGGLDVIMVMCRLLHLLSR